jgi:hypothetical protein
MYFAFIFCSLLDITNWLQNHLLSCPFKKLTGVDCPGCGFQRSIIALIEGNFRKSIQLYPAAIPLLMTALFVLFAVRLKVDNRHIIKKTLYIATGGIMIISYVVKIYTLYS